MEEENSKIEKIEEIGRKRTPEEEEELKLAREKAEKEIERIREKRELKEKIEKGELLTSAELAKLKAEEISKEISEKEKKAAEEELEVKEKEEAEELEKLELEKLENELAEARKEYLQLRKAFYGRVPFLTELKELIRKNPEKAADRLREAKEKYQNKRAEFIEKKVTLEFEKLKEKKYKEAIDERLKESKERFPEKSEEELKEEIENSIKVNLLLNEYRKENEAIEKQLLNEKELPLIEKFKTKWRKYKWLRLGVSAGLFAASTIAVGSGHFYLVLPLIAARRTLASISTAIATEAAFEKLGEKLAKTHIGKLKKAWEKAPEDEKEKAFNKKLEELKLTPEKLAEEIRNFRAIQERKGISLEKAIGANAGFLKLLREKENEVLKEKLKKSLEEGKDIEDINKFLIERFNQELKEIDKAVEKTADKQRKAAIKRWLAAGASSALIFGGLTWLSHYFEAAETTPSEAKEVIKAHLETTKEIEFLKPPEPLPHLEAVEAEKGDSLWKLIEKALEKDDNWGKFFKGLEEPRKTYIIDAIKDKIAADPSKFNLEDIDKINVGFKLDLSKIEPEFLKKIGEKATALTEDQCEAISYHNEAIKTFVSAFKEQFPDRPVTSELIDKLAEHKWNPAATLKDLTELPSKESVGTATIEISPLSGEEISAVKVSLSETIETIFRATEEQIKDYLGRGLIYNYNKFTFGGEKPVWALYKDFTDTSWKVMPEHISPSERIGYWKLLEKLFKDVPKEFIDRHKNLSVREYLSILLAVKK